MGLKLRRSSSQPHSSNMRTFILLLAALQFAQSTDQREGQTLSPSFTCGKYTTRTVLIGSSTTSVIKSDKGTMRCTVLFKLSVQGDENDLPEVLCGQQGPVQVQERRHIQCQGKGRQANGLLQEEQAQRGVPRGVYRQHEDVVHRQGREEVSQEGVQLHHSLQQVSINLSVVLPLLPVSIQPTCAAHSGSSVFQYTGRDTTS